MGQSGSCSQLQSRSGNKCGLVAEEGPGWGESRRNDRQAWLVRRTRAGEKWADCDRLSKSVLWLYIG